MLLKLLLTCSAEETHLVLYEGTAALQKQPTGDLLNTEIETLKI